MCLSSLSLPLSYRLYTVQCLLLVSYAAVPVSNVDLVYHFIGFLQKANLLNVNNVCRPSVSESDVADHHRVCSQHFPNGDSTQLPSLYLGKHFRSPKKIWIARGQRASKRKYADTGGKAGPSAKHQLQYIGLQVPRQHVHQVIVVMERNLLPVQLYLLPFEKFFLVIIVCMNYLVNVVKSRH